MELPTREKELLTLTPFLSYYDPPRPSVVSADTSSYGIRATFFQEIDGNLKFKKMNFLTHSIVLRGNMHKLRVFKLCMGMLEV